MIEQNEQIDSRIKQIVNQINNRIESMNNNEQSESICNESIMTTNHREDDQNSMNNYIK